MRTCNRVLLQSLIASAGLSGLGFGDGHATSLFETQNRQLVETIRPAGWSDISIWVFESVSAPSGVVQVANRGPARLFVTDGHGKVLRILKPGATALVERKLCGATGVLALSAEADAWPTILECRAGLLYQVKSTSYDANRAEVAP